jgi:hypothetical protein
VTGVNEQGRSYTVSVEERAAEGAGLARDYEPGDVWNTIKAVDPEPRLRLPLEVARRC